jgi:hypothetical protein
VAQYLLEKQQMQAVMCDFVHLHRSNYERVRDLCYSVQILPQVFSEQAK